MRRTGLALRAAFSVMLLACAASAQQTSFGAEDTLRRPVAVPPALLRVLARDERVVECLRQGAGRGEDDDLASWFVASAADLDGDRRRDLVVLPREACLFGANISPFWVFRAGGRGHTLVLKTHALRLDLLRARTNGLRDIRISTSFAFRAYEATYRFDGRRYQPRACLWQSVEEGGRARPHRFRCGDAEKPF